MSEEKDHKITLYMATPTPLLKPGYNPFDRTGVCALSGHAFVGITDKDGKEERWGFSPGESEAFEKPHMMLTGCKGRFSFESKYSYYNEAIVYPVTKEQYEKAKEKIESLKKNKDKKYRLFSSNCATVASSVLRAGGVGSRNPLIKFSPHTLILKKRAMLAKKRVSVALFKAANSIRSAFGMKKVPDEKMLDHLRKKPLPVAIKVGTRTSDYQESLDTKVVLKNLMNRKQAR